MYQKQVVYMTLKNKLRTKYVAVEHNGLSHKMTKQLFLLKWPNKYFSSHICQNIGLIYKKLLN